MQGNTSYIGGRNCKNDGKFSIMLCAFPEAEATSFIVEASILQDMDYDDPNSICTITHSELSKSGMENPAGSTILLCT